MGNETSTTKESKKAKMFFKKCKSSTLSQVLDKSKSSKNSSGKASSKSSKESTKKSSSKSSNVSEKNKLSRKEQNYSALGKSSKREKYSKKTAKIKDKLETAEHITITLSAQGYKPEDDQVEVLLPDNSVKPWGLTVNFNLGCHQWSINGVDPTMEGARQGVQHGWRLLRWNEHLITEENEDIIKDHLFKGVGGKITFKKFEIFVPNKYIITAPFLMSQSHLNPMMATTKAFKKLQQGAIVDVVEIIDCPKQHRIRGKLSDGHYISIKNTCGGDQFQLWAEMVENGTDLISLQPPSQIPQPSPKPLKIPPKPLQIPPKPLKIPSKPLQPPNQPKKTPPQPLQLPHQSLRPTKRIPEISIQPKEVSPRASKEVEAVKQVKEVIQLKEVKPAKELKPTKEVPTAYEQVKPVKPIKKLLLENELVKTLPEKEPTTIVNRRSVYISIKLNAGDKIKIIKKIKTFPRTKKQKDIDALMPGQIFEVNKVKADKYILVTGNNGVEQIIKSKYFSYLIKVDPESEEAQTNMNLSDIIKDLHDDLNAMQERVSEEKNQYIEKYGGKNYCDDFSTY